MHTRAGLVNLGRLCLAHVNGGLGQCTVGGGVGGAVWHRGVFYGGRVYTKTGSSGCSSSGGVREGVPCSVHAFRVSRESKRWAHCACNDTFIYIRKIYMYFLRKTCLVKLVVTIPSPYTYTRSCQIMEKYK